MEIIDRVISTLATPEQGVAKPDKNTRPKKRITNALAVRMCLLGFKIDPFINEY